MGIRPLTSGPVEIDIFKIIEQAALHPNSITYTVILHTEFDDILITELVSIETDRDYVNNVADYTLVTFTLMLGTYIKKVHPNMDNLEMTVTMKHYERAYQTRYKAVIISGPSDIAGTPYSSYTEDELNTKDKLLLEMQCVNRMVEILRLSPVDGIYPYSTVESTIKTVFSNVINDISIGGAVTESNINIVPPNNQKVFRNVIIPTGIRALDFPTYIQTTNYGVYSSDIGTYVQRVGYYKDGVEPKDTIFIYPLYNNELADVAGKKLMILSSPTTILSRVENSYLEDGDILKIIGSGDSRSEERSQTTLIDSGNSLIFSDPVGVLGAGTTVTDDTIRTDSSNNLTGRVLKNKRDGYNGHNYIGPINNIYKYYSEIAKNMLSVYQITWNYSNPELLFPGMPVIYIYDDVDAGVIRLTGILHSNFTKYNASYKTHTTLLNVLLEPYVDKLNKNRLTADVRY